MSVTSVEKDYDSLTLTLIADFDAPVDRVWELWADPRQLESWWGPPTYPATVERHDLGPGGEVAYFMTAPDGQRIRGWWRVTAVEAPTRLEFQDGFADQHGTPIESPVTTVQMRLSDHDGGARMMLRFTFESREHMEQLERRGAFDVFPQSVGQMDAVLTRAPEAS
jgi:uncharacterized protein YndB with AHSA1/START domain